MMAGIVSAQEITISGNVTSAEEGIPLPGVNVVIKGTTSGSVTDLDGHYSINAPGNSVLEFSFIGYEKREIPVDNRVNIDVILSESKFELQEVVVTALGIKREKKALGYSVQEVDGASLEKAKEPNVISSLTGRVAGLVVYNKTGLYQNPEFLLRGSHPLIVINGIPNPPYEVNGITYYADLWDISSDDIENITVLKGTTASALYG